MRFIVGDLLTGRRIQTVQAVSGSWTEVLNDAGEVSCTIPLSDPVNRRLGLRNSATGSKTFLAAVEGDYVLQAGPIWEHRFTDDGEHLTLLAKGIWSYFDHLPILSEDGADDPTNSDYDIRYWPEVTDEDADGYPWPSDTRKSYQGMIVATAALVMGWPSADVPVTFPDEIAGTEERWWRPADLAKAGREWRDITNASGGPDLMFTPRLQSDRLGVEWEARIGTPDEPRLFSAQRPTFYVGVQDSSVTELSVTVDTSRMATHAFATGGRSLDKTIVSQATNQTLLDAGYPRLVEVDSSNPTVSEETTIQAFADELALAGLSPDEVWSFAHDTMQRPFVYAFNAGDFAEVRVRDNAYLPDGKHVMRILSRSGDLGSTKVRLQFAPEVA